ncbi:MAG: hypothetical protein ABIZ49_12235 [Opitutaceae bacterium]
MRLSPPDRRPSAKGRQGGRALAAAPRLEASTGLLRRANAWIFAHLAQPFATADHAVCSEDQTKLRARLPPPVRQLKTTRQLK